MDTTTQLIIHIMMDIDVCKVFCITKTHLLASEGEADQAYSLVRAPPAPSDNQCSVLGPQQLCWPVECHSHDSLH